MTELLVFCNKRYSFRLENLAWYRYMVVMLYRSLCMCGVVNWHC